MTLYLGVTLVAAAVVLFMLQPVVNGIHASLERADDEMTETEARKRVALLALRDVEYDFLSGKLDQRDYHSLKSELTAEALDALEADEASKAGGNIDEKRLEAEIIKLREGFGEGVTCPSCLYTNDKESLFCSACGLALADPVSG